MDGPRNLTLSNISPAAVHKGPTCAPLAACHWLPRTVLEFVSARYVALVPVAAITLTTKLACRVLCAVSGGVTSTPSARIPRSRYTTTYGVHCIVLSASRPPIENVLPRLTATAAIHLTRGSFLGCGPRLCPRPRNESMTASLVTSTAWPRQGLGSAAAFKKSRDLPLSGRDSTSPSLQQRRGPLPAHF